MPVEREVARRRVTDVQILDRDAWRNSSRRRMPLVLVADSLRSAFNIGGLFRTAECFGAEALWLCGYSATPEHPHVTEAALGADQLVPWAPPRVPPGRSRNCAAVDGASWRWRRSLVPPD